jgi:hypothetical protein
MVLVLEMIEQGTEPEFFEVIAYTQKATELTN